MGTPLPYDSQDALRVRLREEHPGFLAIDTVEPAAWDDFGAGGAMQTDPFTAPIDNFYMTDPISRASETMAKCVDELLNGTDEATGTDG